MKFERYLFTKEPPLYLWYLVYTLAAIVIILIYLGEI